MIRLGWPKSPKALLEARYKAFKKGDVDFIMASCHPDTRKKYKREDAEAWSRNASWQGLDVESAKEEGETGFVTFTCRYEQDGQDVVHKETAEFRMHEERWYYYNSTFPSRTRRREETKVGRNDPCPCGSGKKYKKCCGK